MSGNNSFPHDESMEEVVQAMAATVMKRIMVIILVAEKVAEEVAVPGLLLLLL